MARKKNVPRQEQTAVIYARYSSHNQNDASIEQQIAECMEYAQKNNLHVIGTYEDRAMTGRADRRPEFQKMLRAAENSRFQVILAYKSNRISRNMLHALMYEDKLSAFGVRTVYAKEEFGDNAAGRFALRTMMNVNQFYSENMAEDIQRGMHDCAMQCKVITGLPLGYKIGEDRKYEINEREAEIVREIFRRVFCRETYAEIAEDLNARGIRTRLGKKWAKGSFHSILANERYIGVYIYDDVRIEGGIPPIVDKEVFYAVQEIVKKKATPTKGRRNEKGEYLLTGKLFCGYCKATMIGKSGTSRNGDLHYYYGCQNRDARKNCRKKNVRREWIEVMVADALKSFVLQDDTIEWVADTVMRYAKKFKEDSQLDDLTERLNESKKASANIMRAIESGIFNHHTQERMLELEAEQNDLNAKIILEKSLIPNVKRENIVYWMRSFRDGNVNDRDFRAKLFDAFLTAVYLYDDKIKIVFNWDKDQKSLDIPFESLEESGECFELNSDEGVRIEESMVHHTLLIRTPVTVKMIGRHFVLAFGFDVIS